MSNPREQQNQQPAGGQKQRGGGQKKDDEQRQQRAPEYEDQESDQGSGSQGGTHTVPDPNTRGV